ncbi:hypothetical protein GEMRC1_007742 [Eukaryota sp. GEM-RC1]
MTNCLLVFSLLLVLCLSDHLRLWPRPQQAVFGDLNIKIADDFRFVSSIHGVDILDSALVRYKSIINTVSLDTPTDISHPTISVIDTILIRIDIPDTNLNLETDERYSIDITSATITLSSHTVFGALRALETLSQLVEIDSSQSLVVRQIPLTIIDYPRYQWRGIMIDTARHYLPISTIKRMIDAASFNKMNVLHWHLVDAQSFPLSTPSHPELATKGAFRADLVYDTATIKDIIAFGKERGVRVVPELDVPGHSYAIGKGRPNIRAQCPPGLDKNVNNFPLDPSEKETFTVLSNLIGDMAEMFDDEFIHLGGDEIVFSCWTRNEKISKWMAKHGFKTGQEVFSWFFNQTLPFAYKNNKKAIVWHDAAIIDDNLPKSTLVQVWAGESNIAKVLDKNFKILYSVGYYLDKSRPAGVTRYAFMQTFTDFFSREPTKGLTSEQAKNITGLEAAMWSEGVDYFSIEERTWPRASGTADRAWIEVPKVVDMTYENKRVERQRCRMNGRGIMASAVIPGPDGICKFAV